MQQHSDMNWEWFGSKRYYAFLVSSKICVAALGQGNVMDLLEIFPDYDGAHQ